MKIYNFSAKTNEGKLKLWFDAGDKEVNITLDFKDAADLSHLIKAVCRNRRRHPPRRVLANAMRNKK